MTSKQLLTINIITKSVQFSDIMENYSASTKTLKHQSKLLSIYQICLASVEVIKHLAKLLTIKQNYLSSEKITKYQANLLSIKKN